VTFMKANLLAAKKNLALAKKGHDLLEVKQNALIQEVRRGEKTVSEIKAKLMKVKKVAERAFTIAAMEIGRETAERVVNETGASPLPYRLEDTTAAVDKAFFARREVIALEDELTKAETALTRQKERLRRTKKRVSALRNISIPNYEKRVKYVTGQIEEHERDEMVRQKAARRLYVHT